MLAYLKKKMMDHIAFGLPFCLLFILPSDHTLITPILLYLCVLHMRIPHEKVAEDLYFFLSELSYF